MREVRMTFGEHLEELRRRIIVSLLYLAVGVTIAFIYGDVLMQVALRPHEYAFRGAQRNRMIARMERAMDDLAPLMTMEPSRAKVSGKTLVDGEIRWEELFAGDVFRVRLGIAVARPFDAAAQRLAALPSLSEPDRGAIRTTLHELGRGLSESLVGEMAMSVDLEGAANIPRRFEAVAERLVKFRAQDSYSDVKKKIGWGKNLDPLVEKVREFSRFLDHRRKQALGTRVTLADLHHGVKTSALAAGLDEALGLLEKSLDTLEDPGSKRIMVIDYTEHFIAYFKVAMIFGAFLAVPFILYELWKFVGAGLHLNEQRYVVTFLPFSLALFVAGVLFGYFVMIPVGLEFLASWGSTDVELSFVLGRYIGLFLTLTLILGLIFQTPLFMVFLNKVGIVKIDFYRKARRISIFVGVCLAVVLTPPDPVSWSLMAAPMILLYEIGILACRFLGRRTEVESEGSAASAS